MPAIPPKDSAIPNVEDDLDGVVEDFGTMEDFVASVDDGLDRVFSNYSDTSFDSNGFLVSDFEFVTEPVFINESGLVEIVGNGVAIYEDTIADLFVNGADSSESYVIYSPICTKAPSIINPETISVYDHENPDVAFELNLEESESSTIDHNRTSVTDTYKYYYSYYSLEETELHTKYACLPGLNSIDEAPIKGFEYVNTLVNEACLEIFSTIPSREFTPQRIKQRSAIQQIATETTLGQENQIADGSLIASVPGSGY